MGRNGNGNGAHYESVNRSDVPQGRKGKHRKAVAGILNGDKMQNLRSALNRVTREKNIPVETSSDEKYLYVWRADPPKDTGATG